MDHPSRAISAFIVIAATPVVLIVLFQIWGIVRKGELRREAPLPPLTRTEHPIVYWSIAGTGVLGAVLASCGIIVALHWLLA